MTAARVIVGIVGGLLVVSMLSEFFVTFMLPRRVKRDPRIARGLYRGLWRGWRAWAARLPENLADTVLGFFGPLGVLVNLAVWTLGIVLGFACLFWSDGSALSLHGVDFGDDLYYSAGAFFSASTNLNPSGGFGRVLQLGEAASGFAVLFVAIGYLPALYQAFSRREIAVSQLDPRAGSPPTAGTLLLQAADRGRWDELGRYLAEWETWTAELMETHLAYPVLGYFRSQHLNQNWLASLTSVVDGCSFFLAAVPDKGGGDVVLTFAIGRHALPIDGLPDGAMLAIPGEPNSMFALRGESLLRWRPDGYGDPRLRPRGIAVDVLTPPSILAVLAQGYRPQWHRSAAMLGA